MGNFEFYEENGAKSLHRQNIVSCSMSHATGIYRVLQKHFALSKNHVTETYLKTYYDAV